MKAGSKNSEENVVKDVEKEEKSSLEIDGVVPTVYKNAAGTGATDDSEDDFIQNPYLTTTVQKNMEHAFGHDFSNVNIYENSPEANKLGALAFAHGNEIHFSENSFNPYTTEGAKLLKHELAHVVQQREGKTNALTEGQLEREADQLSDGGTYRSSAPTVNFVANPIRQFKWFEITATEIEEIREEIKNGNARTAYRKIKKILRKPVARDRFFLDYPDIAVGLLKNLDEKKDKKAIVDISKNLIVPPTGMSSNPSFKDALSYYKEQNHLTSLESLAIHHSLTLKTIIDWAELPREVAVAHPNDLLLALEENAEDKIAGNDNLAAFVSDLPHFMIIDQVEKQAGLNGYVKPAKTQKYFGVSGYMHVYGYNRKQAMKPIKDAKGRKAKKAARKQFKNNYTLPPLLKLLFKSYSKKGTFVLRNLRMGDIEELLHQSTLGGINFDPDAKIEELIVNPEELTTTIRTPKLSIDALNMVDGQSGMLADQLDLANVEITLSFSDGTQKINAIDYDETSHAVTNLKADIDLHNLRMIDHSTTTAIGRIKIDNLNLKFEQDISARNTFNYRVKEPLPLHNPLLFQLLTLSAMLGKGPMLLQPMIYGVINAFVLDRTHNDPIDWHTFNEIASTYHYKFDNMLKPNESAEGWDQHARDYKSSLASMLSDNLSLELNYDQIEIDHFVVLDETFNRENFENKTDSYIGKILLVGDQEEGKNEFSIKSLPITQEQIDAALASHLLDDLADEVQKEVRRVVTVEDYQDLANRSLHNTDRTRESMPPEVTAAEYFELFRQADFDMSVANGEITDGHFVNALVLPILDDIITNTIGAEALKIEGVENAKFKNLEISTRQDSRGAYSSEETNKFQGVKLDLELPSLKAASINYDQQGIQFVGNNFDFETVTLGLELGFNGVESDEVYGVSIGKIEAKKGTIGNTHFNYDNGLLEFESTKSEVDKVWFEMSSDVSGLGLGFDKISLENAAISYNGQHNITADHEKETVLIGGSFNKGKDGMHFTLWDLIMDGTYADQDFNSIEFQRSGNIGKDTPLFQYDQTSDQKQFFRLHSDVPMLLPQLCLTFGANKYLDLTNANVNNIDLDLELHEDKIVLNQIAIDEICADEYKMVIDGFVVDDKKQTDDPFILKGLGAKNIVIETMAPVMLPTTSLHLINNNQIQAPQIENLNYKDLQSDLHPELDNTPQSDKLLTESIPPMFRRLGPENNAEIKLDEFSPGAFILSKDKTLRFIVEMLAIKGISAKSMTGELYGLEDLHKFIAEREVKELTTSGIIQSGKVGEEEAIGSWESIENENGSLKSLYVEQENSTYFENIPRLKLSVPKLDFEASGFNIKSEISKGNAAEISNIIIDGVRINHSTGEIEVDYIGIPSITANGLEVNTNQMGWGINLDVDQRASVMDIELKGWKTKLNDPTELNAQGNKATLDISRIILPRIIADLTKGKDEKAKGGVTASIGKIAYEYYKSGAQNLTVNDLLFSESQFNWENEAEYINQFLSKVSAKKVRIELDKNGHKTIILTDPTIEGYKINTPIISGKGTLKCTGEMRIFEGDYESFTNQMTSSLLNKKSEYKQTGIYDAWLIDAADCQIEITDISYDGEFEENVDWRNPQQKAIDLALSSSRSTPEEVVGGPASIRDNSSKNSNELLNQLITLLELQGESKVQAQDDYLNKNDRYFQMTEALSLVNGELFLQLGSELLSIKIDRGKIDFDQIIADLRASLRDNIEGIELPNNEDLQRIAAEILDVVGESKAAALLAIMLLLMVLGGSVGIFGGGIGAVLGGFFGFFLGMLVAPLLYYFNFLNYRKLVGMVQNVCKDIVNGSSYNESLMAVLDWLMDHLDIVQDKQGYHLGLVVNSKDNAEQSLISKTVSLLQIGNVYDTHVDAKTNEVEVAGLVKFFMKNPGKADLTEFEILDRIHKMKNEEVPASEILNEIYSPEAAEQFRINGIFAMLGKEDFGVGYEEIIEIIQDLSINNLPSKLNVYATLNGVDLSEIEHVYNFDNNEDELRWIDRGKTRIYSYYSLNSSEAQLRNEEYSGEFATGPISGFTYENEAAKIGFGNMSLPQIDYRFGTNPENENTNLLSLGSETSFKTSGLQLAYRNKPEERIESNKSFVEAKVKNPSYPASYQLMDKDYNMALWEFSVMTKQQLTHLMVIDGDFLRAGDPWYFDILHKSGIEGNANVGFVRECDTEDNTVNNYIGTLKVDIMVGARKFVPFNGKQK